MLKSERKKLHSIIKTQNREFNRIFKKGHEEEEEFIQHKYRVGRGKDSIVHVRKVR